MKELDINSVESSEMVEQTFKFWFNDNEHIRSPFPEYIRTNLKEQATEKFFDWANNLHPKAKDELNDEMVGEKFEEIIFNIASTLVLTEDERLTILYPFLPRIGDKLQEPGEEDSLVIDRSFVSEGDTKFLKVNLERGGTNEKWDTKIELPM